MKRKINLLVNVVREKKNEKEEKAKTNNKR